MTNPNDEARKYLAYRWAVHGVGAARDLPIPVEARDCLLAVGALEESEPWIGPIRLEKVVGKKQSRVGLKSLMEMGYVESAPLTEQLDGEKEAFRVSSKGKPVYDFLVELLKGSEETFGRIILPRIGEY